MFTFGKKISFRPLIIALIFLLVVGSPIAGAFGMWGWAAGIGVFIVVVCVYYPGVLELEFNYIEITDHEIKYYDFRSWWKRVLMVFMGPMTPLKSIDLDEIVSARTIRQEKGEKMPVGMAIPASNFIGAFAGAVSTIQNLYWIEIELENGKKIKLSLAHDKAYNTEKTVKKAKLAVEWILADKKKEDH